MRSGKRVPGRHCKECVVAMALDVVVPAFCDKAFGWSGELVAVRS